MNNNSIITPKLTVVAPLRNPLYLLLMKILIVCIGRLFINEMPNGGEMLQNSRIFLLTTVIFILSIPVHSDKYIQLKIGPTWPVALRGSKKPTAWDASMHYGAIFERRVAIGGGLDFLWNNNNKDVRVSGNVYRREMTEKTFMFPISGYIALSPIPDYRFHPCISGQIGFNTMYFSHEDNSVEEEDTLPAYDENGWYIGFYWKIAADVIFNLGENTGLFVGLEYQWSNPEKVNDKKDDLFTRRNMSGIGIRMGFRLIY